MGDEVGRGGEGRGGEEVARRRDVNISWEVDLT